MADSKKKNVSTAELAAKNLAQIQKIDPCAQKLLDKVPFVSLFKFQTDKREWVKTDIEGAFFVYQRADRPYFSLLIANQQSPNDYVEPITTSIKYSPDDQYLFINTESSINGLWFCELKDCERITALVGKLIDKLKLKETTQPVSVVDSRSMQLLELIKGGQHNKIQTPSAGKDKEVPSDENDVILRLAPKPHPSTANRNSTGDNSALPVLLQKLMIQEQPRTMLKEPGTAMLSDELEKDLLKTAKPRNANLLQEFTNSPSAASLAAFSTRSVHGSEGDNDQETESILPESSFAVGSGIETPPLNKDQMVAALTNLLQSDDQFVAQIHQAYVDALNRRLRLDN